MAYTQPQHPRFSALSSSSLSSAEHLSPTASSTRFSIASAPSINTTLGSARPVAKLSIYDRHLNKTKTSEVSGSAFAFLFSEVVQYTQKRVSGINDLERRLNTLGYRIGTRVLELMVWRAESASKNPKREIRFLPALMSIHTQVWRAVFAKPADAIEKSVENDDEYMIIDNDPMLERYISVPRDMSQLSCSSLTAGIVEAVLDGLGFPARVTAHNTPTQQWPSRTTILIKLESSCVWASEKHELQGLYESPHTGAVTTRTATLHGFNEGPSHAVVFTSDSSLNSYGYSPHPLDVYLAWLKDIITSDPASKKPFIISITTTTPSDLVSMLESIQDLRVQLNDSEGDVSRIGIELNTSCPNITASPPPSYNFPSLRPLLEVLSNFFSNDKSLTVGLKLPPYVFERQFEDAIAEISAYSSKVNKAGGDDNDDAQNPFAFLTCTNTLGSSLLFSSQTLAGADTANAAAHAPFALAPVLGGLAGSALHPLALGNVYTFTALIARSPDAGVRRIAVVGVGGVEDHEGVQRMRRAGARVVGCATALGREGVGVFERLVTVD